MKMIVVSYATTAEVEAERDDPSVDLKSMATPSFSRACFELTDAVVALVKAEAVQEMVYGGDLEEGDDGASLTWSDGGWEDRDGGLCRKRVLTATDALGDVVAMIVAQEREIQ